MAEFLKTALNFRTSRSLFRKEDGAPILFYSVYYSDDLKNVIERSGGCLVLDPTEADYLLCEKKTDNKINEGYLPLDFIVDCVKKNMFINAESYRANDLGLKASTSKSDSIPSSADCSEENLMKISGSSRIRVSASGLSGRKRYTYEEDLEIIKYLINHDKYSDTGGNIVWKQMQDLKVTDHPYQSMKARFQKKILPDIETYDIPEDWKAKLQGYYDSDAPPENGKELNEDVYSFNDFDTWKNKEKRLKQTSAIGPVPILKDKDRSPEKLPGEKSLNTKEAISFEITLNAPSLSEQHSLKLGTSTEQFFDGLELTPVTNISSDNLMSVSVKSVQAKNSGTAINLNESCEGNSLEQVVSSPNTHTDSQSPDYVYDEMDCLIIKEAKRKASSEDMKSDTHQDRVSNAAVIAPKQAKDVNDHVSDTASPRKIRNIDSVANEPGRESNKIYMEKSPVKANETCSLSSKEKYQANNNLDKEVNYHKQLEKLVTYEPSVDKILKIVEKGPSTSRTKRSTRGSDSESTDHENDSRYKYIINTRKVRKRHERNVSPEIELLESQSVTNNSGRLESLLQLSDGDGTRIHNKHHVNYVDHIEHGMRDLQAKPVNKNYNVYDNRNSSSKTHKGLVSAKDRPSTSSSESSPNKHTKQSTKTRPADTNSSDDRTEAKLTRYQEDALPELNTKMLALTQIKYVSDVYGLDMEEAATLLWMHDGSMLSVIKYFES